MDYIKGKLFITSILVYKYSVLNLLLRKYKRFYKLRVVLEVKL